jgi:type IV secretion system protein VirD4
MKLVVNILGGIITGILELTGELLSSIFITPKQKRKEVLDAGFLPEKELLDPSGQGFTFGKGSITLQESCQSSISLGGSGSGKSSTVCIPTIYNLIKQGCSLVVNDGNREIFPLTAPFAHANGYEIKLTISDLSISDGLNLVSRIKNASECMKTSEMLTRNAMGDKSRDFWYTQTVLMNALCLRILKEQEDQYQNFANLKHLVDNIAIDGALDLVVARTKDQQIKSEYFQFLSMDNKLLSSIVASSRNSLSIFTDPILQVTTAFDTIDFSSFRKSKIIHYILSKPTEAQYLSVLTAMYFENFFGYILEKKPDESDNNIFFIIDEAGVNLKIPSLCLGVSQLRKFNCGIMLLAQDFNQFITLYGREEAESIRSNCFTKCYFPGQPITQCIELERTLGNFQFEDDKGILRSRPLMTADEIRAMEDSVLIIAGAKRAVQTKLLPFYKNPKYQSLPNLPMPEFKSKVPFDTVPLLPLPKLSRKHGKEK